MPLYHNKEKSRAERQLEGAGFIAETYSRIGTMGDAGGNYYSWSNGSVGEGNATLIALNKGEVITNLHCLIGTAGDTVTYGKMALYDKSGTQLAITGDEKTAFDDNSGLQTMALTAAYTVPTTDVYYVCVLQVATTAATLLEPSSFTGVGAAAGSGKPLSVSQGNAATLEASVTFTVNAHNVWFAVS